MTVATVMPTPEAVARGGTWGNIPVSLLHQMIDQARDLIVLVTPTGECVYVSPSIEQILGYSPTDLVDANALDLIDPDEHGTALELLRGAARGETGIGYVQLTAVAKDGSRRRLEAIGTRIVGCGGELRVLVNARDITERVAAEVRLRESEERFRGLVTSMTDVAFVLDRDQRYTGIYGGVDATQDAGHRQLGRTAAETMGPVLGRIHATAAAKALAGERVVYEWLQERGERHMQTLLSPLRGAAGEIAGAVGVSRDVTRLRAAEESARSAATLLSAVIEASPLGIAVLDLGGIVELWNAAAEQLTGWPAADVLGQHCRGTLPDDGGRILERLHAIADGGGAEGLNTVHQRRDGSRFDARLAFAPIRGECGEVERVIVVLEDVSEQLAAQERLRRRDRMMQALSRLARRLLWDSALEPSFERALGELGRAADASRAWVMQRVVTTSGRLCLAGSWEWCAPGSIPQIGNPEVQLVDVVHHGLESWMAQLERGDLVAHVVAELPPPQQEALSSQDILSVAIAPIQVGEEFWGVLGFDDCVTARQWSSAEMDGLGAAAELFGAAIHRARADAELRLAKEQAESANVAKTDFLARMSHELRTPLTSVIGFTHVLQKRLAPDFAEEEYMLLQRVSANAVHLLALINDLLDISKVEAGKLEVINVDLDVCAVVRETAEQFEGVREPVRLVLELPANVKPLRTDAAKLKQVLLNLVGNAFKFTEYGTVSVGLTLDPGGQPEALYVTDTGIGIPSERLAAIFDAFEQADAGTGRRYGGTGLGLTISRALCGLMGHSLTVASRPGEGSTFTVRFNTRAADPVADAPGLASAPR